MALKSRLQSITYAKTVTRCEHPTEDILTFARTRRGFGYQFLGSGIDKKAYALPCGLHVLKVSLHPSEASYQMRAEIRRWIGASAAERRILAPIRAVDEGHTMILCDRVKTGSSMRGTPGKYNRLIEKAENEFGINDLHAGNIGTLRGRAVVLDYGY